MLFDKLVELMVNFENDLHKVALVIDSRSKDINSVLDKISQLKDKYEAKIVFIHASEDVILKRYKETRRKHPMGENLMTLSRRA